MIACSLQTRARDGGRLSFFYSVERAQACWCGSKAMRVRDNKSASSRQHVQDSRTASASVGIWKFHGLYPVGNDAFALSISLVLDEWNFTQIRNAFLRPRNASSVLSGDNRRRMGKRNSAVVECETGSKPSAERRAAVVALPTA